MVVLNGTGISLSTYWKKYSTAIDINIVVFHSATQCPASSKKQSRTASSFYGNIIVTSYAIGGL